MSHSYKKHPYQHSGADHYYSGWLKKTEHKHIRSLCKAGVEIGNGNEYRKHDILRRKHDVYKIRKPWIMQKEDFLQYCYIYRFHELKEVYRFWSKHYLNK